MSTVLKIIGAIVLVLIVLALGGAAIAFLVTHAAPVAVRGFGVAPRALVFGGGLGLVIFGLLIRLLFWLVVIAAVVWLVSALVRGSARPVAYASAQQTPIDILKARYAKGEITKEQYDQLKRDLEA
ncbi:MAG: SHOCT domain-containing protein [Chloroflexi bacterium]|nr:SHOCT domain-containing protein [Chloroflexota bacterium]